MKKAVLAVAVVSAFAVPAFAETNLNPFEDSKSGFYLGLGLGAADYDDSYSTAKDFYNEVGASGTLKYTTRDAAWKVFGGYRVNKYFGVEASYNNLGNPDADFYPSNGRSIVETEAEIKGYGLKAIGYYPINNSFELLASVGALKWEVEEETKGTSFVTGRSAKFKSKTEKGTSLTVGLGANYNLTDNIAFGLQWERINDVGDKKLAFGETDIDTYTLSAQYKF
ncbi:outer membrane beta-barrel protein [Spartinivicinus poritis]|uniref:Outer membrane beta-barrel protein n=1 Tax=Spartinivicinus poritis TaxID=2994640 RepID=A0ABT5UI50_9GAMM|nr:outer membrane beta-barrel protein [Spartinivicinus sp. A2-2]MDE1465885.1 outer membrane beta-barrel protein [Spartinivicinus sp. A2-2]